MILRVQVHSKITSTSYESSEGQFTFTKMEIAKFNDALTETKNHWKLFYQTNTNTGAQTNVLFHTFITLRAITKAKNFLFPGTYYCLCWKIDFFLAIPSHSSSSAHLVSILYFMPFIILLYHFKFPQLSSNCSKYNRKNMV